MKHCAHTLRVNPSILRQTPHQQTFNTFTYLLLTHTSLWQIRRTLIYRPLYPGQPEQAGIRKVKTIPDFNDTRDDEVAVVSAGPYANHLHLAPVRWPRQHLITQFLQTGSSCWCPTNNVKAMKASVMNNNKKEYRKRMWANAQRDGRPAEHWWCPLFNATKFGWRPLLDAVQ